jgi:hypothetical protein
LVLKCVLLAFVFIFDSTGDMVFAQTKRPVFWRESVMRRADDRPAGAVSSHASRAIIECSLCVLMGRVAW